MKASKKQRHHDEDSESVDQHSTAIEKIHQEPKTEPHPQTPNISREKDLSKCST